MPDSYPHWFYYPSRVVPPPWVQQVVDAFSAAQPEIDSEHVQGKQSDGILAELAAGLAALGFVEHARMRSRTSSWVRISA